MLLLVDAGNTRIKWAFAAHGATLGEWVGSGILAHADADRLALAWAGRKPARALLSNVAGPALGARLEQSLASAFGADSGAIEWFASSASRAGIVNGYRDPAQLGSDRFASAIGARALHPNQPLLVVSCGTATTIDAIDAAGRFTGGMILPGLGTMANSLALNTAQLPEVAQHLRPKEGFADNTSDAIVAGCLAAQAGAIARAHALHQAASGGASPRCLISGGAARFIAPRLSILCECVDNLVLIGLHAAAQAD